MNVQVKAHKRKGKTVKAHTRKDFRSATYGERHVDYLTSMARRRGAGTQKRVQDLLEKYGGEQGLADQADLRIKSLFDSEAFAKAKTVTKKDSAAKAQQAAFLRLKGKKAGSL